MTRSPRALLLAAALPLAIGVACKRPAPPTGGGAPTGLPSGASPVTGAPIVNSPVQVVAPPGAQTPASFAELAAKADAAVVFVKTLQERRGLTGRRQVVGEGVGSAFVYDPNGLIITNNHVIDGASEIYVVFGRKRQVKATIVGRDPRTDVAVIRVEEKNLPFLPLGDSEAIRVGDWVVAIGNPFGLSHTVSAGIISARGRTIADVKGLDESGYYDFLQTDASINPGNSGGPLLDMAGRVVGMNTAIRRAANNIGFAIPVNMIKELLPRLLADGSIKRSAIGVVVAPLMPEDRERLKLPEETGVLVSVVVPGGPADKAGLVDRDAARCAQRSHVRPSGEAGSPAGAPFIAPAPRARRRPLPVAARGQEGGKAGRSE